MLNKANLRDLIATTGLVILHKLDSNRRFFSPCELEIWWMTSKNNRAPFLYYIKLCVTFQNHWWIQTGVTVRKCSIQVKIDNFFVSRDLEIWCMTLKNNRALLLYYVKPCASFQSHRWIQTWVTVWKHSIRIVISAFLSCVTLKFDGWPWKPIGHLLYAASSLMHNFIAISEFKHELQSGNAQIVSKSAIFCPVLPWYSTHDLEQGKSEGFDSSNRPSNLTQIGFKSSIFQPVWAWNLMDDPKKQ